MLREPHRLAALTALLTLGACSALSAAPSLPFQHQAAATTARKASSGVPADGPKLTGYFAANPIDGAKLLGPPPAADSLRGRADQETYTETRKLQGSPRWAAAIADDDIWKGGALGRYSCALGVRLGDKETPATSRLLHRIELDVRTVGAPPKDFYNRRRPMLDDDQPICIARADWMKTNASYPSGHSMTGWAWALVLSELAPARSDALMAAGKAVGQSRVICGVHYQSDVEAGRTLSSVMVARLHADPQFQADLARARAELSKAPSSPLSCPADQG